MIKILLTNLLFLLAFSLFAQDSTFVFLANNSSNKTYKIYSIKVGGSGCAKPYDYNGNNDLYTFWGALFKNKKSLPWSIAIIHNPAYLYDTLCVTDNNNNLFKGALDPLYGLLDNGYFVGQFPGGGRSDGLTADNKGFLYSAVKSRIDVYNPMTNTFYNLGTHNGWEVSGDLIFWGGKLFEVSDSVVNGARTNFSVFEVDTSQKPAKFNVYIPNKDFGGTTLSSPIFAIASIKLPCDYNQVYAIGQNGELFALDMHTKKLGAKIQSCNLATLSGNNTIYDAASIAESGIDQKPTPPVNPLASIDLCKGQPFAFTVTVNDPIDDTLRWYQLPNMPPSPPGIPQGTPVVNTNITDTATYLITEYSTVTKCESDTVSITVRIHDYPSKPTITISADTICFGSKTTLTSSATSGNQWFKNGTVLVGETNQVLITVDSGKYTVAVTNEGGCTTTSDTSNVTVIYATINYVGTPFCANGTAAVSLIGKTGGVFSATPSGLMIDSITGLLNNALSQSGSYTVTYNLNGMGYTCPFTTPVSINSSIAIISYPDTSFCQIQSTQAASLSGRGSFTGGSFHASPVGLTIDASTGTITPATSAMGNYTITYSFNDPVCGLISTQTFVSIVNQLTPFIKITTPTTSVCPNTNVTFTASISSGGTSPIYKWQKNGIDVGNNSGIYTDNNIVNGDSISCTLTSNSPCVSITTATSNGIKMVVLNPPLPTITVNTNKIISCEGSAINFKAITTNVGTNINYQWLVNGVNKGTNSPSFIISTLNNNDSVNCILTSTGVCSVSSIKSRAIILNITPPSVSISKDTVCYGGTYVFNGKQYNKPGTYNDTLKTSVGCDSIASLILTQLPPSISLTTDTICEGSSISFNGKVYTKAGTYADTLKTRLGCDSVATLLLSIGSPNTSTTIDSICDGKSYLFNGNTYLKAGTYTATLKNKSGCDSIATLQLIILPKPYVDSITGNNTLCYNTSTQLTQTTTGGYWSSNNQFIAAVINSGLVTGVNTGNTQIMYTKGNNCGFTIDTFPINVYGAPPISDGITTKQPTCTFQDGGSINVSVTGKEAPYTFNFNGTLYSSPFTINHLTEGIYNITIYNATNCIVENAYPKLTLKYDSGCDTLYVPTGFTPDKEINNRLKPFGGKLVSSVTFKVFNRYGNTVFETHDLLSGWDGRFNGKAQNADVYVWFLQYTNKGRTQTLKGTSVLMR